MKIKIPAKTFLVGEYLALNGGPAILLTTDPCFEIHSCAMPWLHGIHPESPAGRLWGQQLTVNVGLTWVDPYHGLGGLGASSAQFLAVYRALNSTQEFCAEHMLSAYMNTAYKGIGTAPSGYDVLAQNSNGCVHINQKKHITCYAWPFDDLSFILVHTGGKLATHHHLEVFNHLKQADQLTTLVHATQQAFIETNSQLLIESINSYYQILLEQGLVADHTSAIIKNLKSEPDLLAAKGCGAMGADIILLIVPRNNLDKWENEIIPNNLRCIANTNALYSHNTSEIT